MIHHENILLFRIDLTQAVDPHSHPANCEDQPSPQSGDSIRRFAAVIKGSKQNDEKSRQHGDGTDHKQLEAKKHEDAVVFG